VSHREMRDDGLGEWQKRTNGHFVQWRRGAARAEDAYLATPSVLDISVDGGVPMTQFDLNDNLDQDHDLEMRLRQAIQDSQ
jgi:hypothetical protein